MPAKLIHVGKTDTALENYDKIALTYPNACNISIHNNNNTQQAINMVC